MTEELTELITIEQLPVVAERFSQMIGPVQERVNSILAMECNEETKGEVKKARADLNKFRKALSNAAKAKKNELFAPWNIVETEIKRIDSICGEADTELQGKIGAIETAQKNEKKEEIQNYYNEKRKVLELDWLDYERMNLNIRLSDSLTALRKAVDQFTDKVSGDVTAILAMPDSAEIMSEYKQSLDLGYSVKAVNDRKERIKAEAARLEQLKEEQQKAAEHAESVQKAAQSAEEHSAVLTQPEVKQVPAETPQPEEQVSTVCIYTANIRVRGTMQQLRRLKQFIVDNNIEILPKE